MDQFTGGCLCGDVRFVASGQPYRVGICHCLDCRKHHGALFQASAVFPQDAVTIDGETQDYDGRFFCPRWGSSVFGHSDDEIEVNLGSLDSPDQLMPTYESWIVRRDSWLPPFPLKRRYDGNRDLAMRRTHHQNAPNRSILPSLFLSLYPRAAASTASHGDSAFDDDDANGQSACSERFDLVATLRVGSPSNPPTPAALCGRRKQRQVFLQHLSRQRNAFLTDTGALPCHHVSRLSTRFSAKRARQLQRRRS
jgi:hypothetical protein